MVNDKQYWADCFRKMKEQSKAPTPGSDKARENWNARASRFAHGRTHSDYIPLLINLIDAPKDATIFDMGCGSGALSIPLAEQGHDIIAVDFSTGMLDELRKEATKVGVMDRIQVFTRSWQEDWDGIPGGDIAISSRSFVVENLEMGIAKLESRATQKAIITVGAGERPYSDHRIFEAMGRGENVMQPPTELMIIANYLWCSGRYPHIDYVEYPGFWHQDSREDLVASITKTHEPQTPEEETALAAFLEEHIIYDEAKQYWTLDYKRTDRWAVISWPVE